MGITYVSAAFLDMALRAAAMLPTTASALLMLSRRAIQPGSSYESYVAATAFFL